MHFFHGAYLFVRYLRNKKYQSVSYAIHENLKFREKIEHDLDPFIRETAKNTKDVSIRFVHWKNYPWNLDDDGYKFLLRINYIENKKPHYGWIDNTGINFEEPLSFFSNSVYIDKDDIFFIAEKNQSFKGFREYKDSVLILHLPFTNIVNFDFKQRIEYEPVFYTRYYYRQWKKLYDDLVILREKEGAKYLNYDLSQTRMLKKYSWLSYHALKVKLWFFHLFNSKDTDHPL